MSEKKPDEKKPDEKKPAEALKYPPEEDGFGRMPNPNPYRPGEPLEPADSEGPEEPEGSAS